MRQNWLAEQEDVKLERIEVVFAYFDGTGHRASCDVKKGDSIGAFLEKARTKVPELKGISVDSLMFVKDDLIIPLVRSTLPAPLIVQHHTFYEVTGRHVTTLIDSSS